jgi:hypothetical protein
MGADEYRLAGLENADMWLLSVFAKSEIIKEVSPLMFRLRIRNFSVTIPVYE